MKLNLLQAQVWNVVYDNSLDPYVPEHWANESLAILEENMVIQRLVHTDFSDEIAEFGDVVNTRRPGEFVMKRKGVNDNVVFQNATATNVPVPLDQHGTVGFQLKDAERSKSFKDLVSEYMRPGMLGIARGIDQILLAQVYRFMANSYGTPGGLTSSTVIDYVTGLRNKMNINKAYVSGRNLILTPNAETTFLRTGAFTEADKVGDRGTALRTASLGDKFGFGIYMCQNMSSISTSLSTNIAGAINLMAGYPAGTTVLAVDGFTGAVVTGAHVSIAGAAGLYRVTAHTETLGNTTQITISPALASAVVDNAVVSSATPGAVNQSLTTLAWGATGYPAGYDGYIAVDGFTAAPQVGQLVQFGTADTNLYTVIGQPSTTSIQVDRPLVAGIADNAIVVLGGGGEYNFAFHRNALAFVSRPLSAPLPGTGARSAVVSLNGLSVRVTMQYDIDAQSTKVVIDLLFGTAVLDVNLGAVLLG